LKPFILYASSAGSGKTWTLAKEYLSLALRGDRNGFRHILAVTFTNKATQEMKDRIIGYLTEFSQGKKNDLGAEICKINNFTEEELQVRSAAMLSSILHQYHDFSISTIDAFFQRVIRTFIREVGLNGNYTLELDTSIPMGEIVDDMMEELGSDEEVTRWIKEFSRERLQEGRSWNVSQSLRDFGSVIFRESFKIREAEIIEHLSRHSPSEMHRQLKKMFRDTRENLIAGGTRALKQLSDNSIEISDFSNGAAGTAYSFFSGWSKGKGGNIGPRIRNSAETSDAWVRKKSGPGGAALKELADRELIALLRTMLAEQERFNTLQLMLKQFYEFGLLAHIIRRYSDWKGSRNAMVIADAPQFLQQVIAGSDTPFLYERTGTRYQHFLIDEFQDTSRMQWMNFKPLVENSLAEGNLSLVVGDVKQSIYRFRGSDPGLLAGLPDEIGPERTAVRNLSANFRSSRAVIEFNNLFFSTASRLVDAEVEDHRAGKAYEGVKQEIRREANGSVEVRFFKDWNGDGREQALNTIPRLLESIQEAGGKPGDITILVRENKEGTEIVRHLLQYKTSAAARPGVVYDVVSGESLRLDIASSVSFMLASMKLIARPQEVLTKGEVLLEWWKLNDHDADGGQLETYWQGNGPLLQLLDPVLSTISVTELAEELIRRFRLGERTHELAYLQAFQDAILEFQGRERNDLNAFLEWWEDNRGKKSVRMPETADAVRLFSIHKSKGLEFPYVIIPFCDWPLDNTRHPATLWCAAPEPFQEFGTVPLKYGPKMKETGFENDYREERSRNFLDNLNLIYVAFTRASEALFIMAPESKNEKEGFSSTGDLVLRTIGLTPELASGFNPNEGIYRLNLFTVRTEEPKPGLETISLNGYASWNWRDRLMVKRQGQEYFKAAPDPSRERVNTGILVHQVLARVKHRDELEPVLTQCREEGIVLSEELQSHIRNMLDLEPVKDWFNGSWNVRTEATVMMPGGIQKRLDRVMTKTLPDGSQTAAVVDFKTGEKLEDHTSQVLEYAAQLAEMGYASVTAWLLYLEPAELVEVKTDSAR